MLEGHRAGCAARHLGSLCPGSEHPDGCSSAPTDASERLLLNLARFEVPFSRLPGLFSKIFADFKAPEATGKHFHKSPRVWCLLERPGALWDELEQSDETKHPRGRKYAIRALNELTIHFHSRRTNRPTHTYTNMCAYLWGGNT